jgi:hypothetical protein
MDNVEFEQTIYEALCLEHARDFLHEDEFLSMQVIMAEAKMTPKPKEQELYRNLVNWGLIQTPLQQLIEYNVTNGCGYRKRGKFIKAMKGLLPQDPVLESLLMEKQNILMNKQDIYDNLGRQK